MATRRFANTINEKPIFAERSTKDQNGDVIDQTYLKKVDAQAESEAVAAALNNLDERVNANSQAIANPNLGSRTADSLNAQKLYKGSKEVACLEDIGNATLTIRKNGSTLQTFDANSKTNKTVNIPVPTKTSELTNNSNFVSDGSYVHTDNNFTTAEKTKLAGIEAGAEVNVQSDWEESNSSSDAYIQNKPTQYTLVEGSNVHLVEDTTNHTLTISSDDTVYTGGVGINVDSTTHEISIDTDDVQVDFWHGGSSSAISSGTNLNANVSSTAYRGNSIYVSSGAITLKPGTYAVNAFVKIDNLNATLDKNLYKLMVSGGFTNGQPTVVFDFDNSYAHEEIIEVSFLTANLGSSDVALGITCDALSQLSGLAVKLTYAQVYNLSGIVGSTGSSGGTTTITLSSTDGSVTITESTVGDTKNFNLSVPAQVQADWSQTNSSAKSYIRNKPDLSIYALASSVPTKTSDLTNDSGFITLNDVPAQEQADWDEADSSAASYIKNKPTLFSGSYDDLTNKPDLSQYALVSSLATVATSGQYSDLSGKPDLSVYVLKTTQADTDQAVAAALNQLNSRLSNAESNIANPYQGSRTFDEVNSQVIKLGGKDITTQLNAAIAEAEAASEAASQAASQAESAAQSIASELAEPIAAALNNLDARVDSLAENALAKNIGDRTADKFNAQQLYKGGKEVASVDQLPTVNNATLTIQKNGTTLGTWNANQSTAKTINVTVPTKTSELTNNSNFVADSSYTHTDNNFTTTEKTKLAGIEAGAEVNVQSDWEESNSSSDAYIANKPTQYTLIAGTGIVLTEDTTNHTLTISLA